MRKTFTFMILLLFLVAAPAQSVTLTFQMKPYIVENTADDDGHGQEGNGLFVEHHGKIHSDSSCDQRRHKDGNPGFPLCPQAKLPHRQDQQPGKQQGADDRTGMVQRTVDKMAARKDIRRIFECDV